jgi:hypothetical protein
VNVGPTSVEWSPAVDSEGLVLTVVGPGGMILRQETKAGQAPSLGLLDSKGHRLLDGIYAWELRAIPHIDLETREAVTKARDTGDESALRLLGKTLPERPLVQSGSFAVKDAIFVAVEPPKVPAKADSKIKNSTAKDLVETGNLVVKGNTCIGSGCTDTDATFPVLKLKGPDVGILFDDQATPEEDPPGSTRKWALVINSGADQINLLDIDASSTPFRVAGDAPDSSLSIASNGNLGLGTSTPAQDIHVISGNSPAIRLEQDGTGGPSARTWDVGANETSFFVRDVTNSSAVPFQVRAGAPTSSIDVAANGNVGIGTSSPSVRLDVKANTSGAAVARVQNSSATGYSGFEYLNNAGNATAFLGTDNANGFTRFNSIQNFPIVILTESVERMRVTSAGSVGIGTSSPSSKLHVNGGDIRVSGGSFIDDGVTLNAPDYVFEPDYSLMPIEELRAFVAREKRLPNVPSARDIKSQGLNLSQFQMRLLEKVEELTLYTLTQQEQIAKLTERLAALEKVQPASSPVP